MVSFLNHQILQPDRVVFDIPLDWIYHHLVLDVCPGFGKLRCHLGNRGSVINSRCCNNCTAVILFLRTAKFTLKNMFITPFVAEKTDRRFSARKQLGGSSLSIFNGR
jgi:hypothetical protein